MKRYIWNCLKNVTEINFFNYLKVQKLFFNICDIEKIKKFKLEGHRLFWPGPLFVRSSKETTLVCCSLISFLSY